MLYIHHYVHIGRYKCIQNWNKAVHAAKVQMPSNLLVKVL